MITEKLKDDITNFTNEYIELCKKYNMRVESYMDNDIGIYCRELTPSTKFQDDENYFADLRFDANASCVLVDEKLKGNKNV